MSSLDLQEFEQQIEALRKQRDIKKCTSKRDGVTLKDLGLEEVLNVMESSEAGHYFLMAAADLDRTVLKTAMLAPEAQLVEQRLRRAYVVKSRLPARLSFEEVARTAIAHRARDLRRRGRAQVEGLFRDRLKAEKIPIFMSPPVRRVPGILIDHRKPDGVYPDSSAGLAPRLYLEIKSINRVSDDIQKRLYEIAETSLEMKILYGNLALEGFGQPTTENVAGNPELRAALRARILACSPTVVAFFICSRNEAERYRAGAESFIDRLFFQEEVEECIRFLDDTIKRIDGM
jgi:hypothetical protein